MTKTEAEADTSPVTGLVLALCAGDAAAAAGLIAPEARLHVPQLQRLWVGHDQVAEALGGLLQAFGDLRYRARRRYISPGQVIEEVTLSGRHVGQFADVPPTGRAVELPARLLATHNEMQVLSIELSADLAVLWMALDLPVTPFLAAHSAAAAGRRQSTDATVTVHAVAREEQQEPVAAASRPGAGSRSYTPTRGNRRGVVAGFAAVVAVLLGVAAAVALAISARSHEATPQVAPAPVAVPSVVRSTTAPPSPSPTATRSGGAAPTEPARVVTLSADVLFERGSADLSDAARRAVVRLAYRLRDASGRRTIRVNGYTDNLGSTIYDLRLSRQRAEAVAAIFRQELRDGNVVVTARGYGKADPIASNANERGRRANRRVTIAITAS